VGILSTEAARIVIVCRDPDELTSESCLGTLYMINDMRWNVKRTAITGFLMQEYLKGNRSLWNPFVDMLPRTYDTPQFWPRELLKDLQDDAVFEELRMTEEFEREEYAKLKRAMRKHGVHADMDRYTFELFRGSSHLQHEIVWNRYGFAIGTCG